MRTTDRGRADEDGPPLGSEHPDLGGPDPGRTFGWLLLVSWAGLDAGEVAEALDIPVGTVHSRLHRVRKRLRVDAAASSPTDPREEGGRA